MQHIARHCRSGQADIGRAMLVVFQQVAVSGLMRIFQVHKHPVLQGAWPLYLIQQGRFIRVLLEHMLFAVGRVEHPWTLAGKLRADQVHAQHLGGTGAFGGDQLQRSNRRRGPAV